MSARSELKELIEEAMPANTLVVPDLSTRPDVSGDVPAIVQRFRTPSGPDESHAYRFTQRFEVWVVTPLNDPDDVEDDLDDHVDILAELFAASDAYLWEPFERSRHTSGLQGYRCPSLTLTSTATSKGDQQCPRRRTPPTRSSACSSP